MKHQILAILEQVQELPKAQFEKIILYSNLTERDFLNLKENFMNYGYGCGITPKSPRKYKKKKAV